MKFNDIKPAELAENELLVRLFGDVELENKWGRVTDAGARPHALTWLTLKYLLVNSNRDVDVEEIMSMSYEGKSVTVPEGAMRTRLQRTRGILKPLGLSDMHGLILHNEGKIRINPDFTLISDEKVFERLMGRIGRTELADPEGLSLCGEALELCRGVFMGYTREAAWLKAYQKHYKREFCRLGRETLERMLALDDDGLCALLWRRAIAVVPEEEELHRAVISYMVERGQDLELLRYVSQLAHKGAVWLEDFEY